MPAVFGATCSALATAASRRIRLFKRPDYGLKRPISAVRYQHLGALARDHLGRPLMTAPIGVMQSMNFILSAINAAVQIGALPLASSRAADAGALAERQDGKAA